MDGAVPMIEISATNPILPGLFQAHLPNNPQLWAVLQGRATGSAVVDSLPRPSECMIRTDAALTYFNLRTSQSFLETALDRFRKTGLVWLVWPPGNNLETPRLDEVEVVRRIEFYDCDPQSTTIENLHQSLATGFEIRVMDRALLERCEWRDEMAFYCGSLENFLVNGIGLCLMRGNEIITEAYASALGDRYAEIGAITREAYRGKGYAPIACATLIQTCEARGYQAYWSCDADNAASIRVARKLGFKLERNYNIFAYRGFP
jgi:RimJ/RimL family protein N-acetyltransferase